MNSQPGFLLRLRTGERRFIPSPAMMEVFNVTPDSFYDGGRFWSSTTPKKAAINDALLTLKRHPPAFIDLGGESSRPGSEPIPKEEELARVLPAIKQVRSSQLPSLLSVDTTKSEVAAAALDQGADLINDTSSGIDSHGNMLSLAAQMKAPIILMHRQGVPKTMQEEPTYDNVVEEVFDSLNKRAEAAKQAGIDQESIIIDPGIGFGKTTAHNLQLLRHLPRFKSLGYPVLVGVSMKRLLADLTGDQETEERFFGSLGLQLAAAHKGADVIRTHHGRDLWRSLRAFQAITGTT